MNESFDAIERVLQLADRYGVSLTVVTLIIVAAVKYGPQLAASLKNLLDSNANSIARLTDVIELQSTTSSASERNYASLSSRAQNTHDVAVRCGSHFCDVMEHVGDALNIRPRIDDSVQSIRRELAAAAVDTRKT